MSHQAGVEFFDNPRDWSRYKNIILDYYLKPYLAKVKEIGRPIVVVDLFAGRGRFKSGDVGSPIIIAERLKPHVERGVSAQLVCIEKSVELSTHLEREMAPYRFAQVWKDDCFDCIDRIVSLSRNATVFLYVDPFEASQLRMDDLAKIYQLIQRGSVEVLEVFMAWSVLRHARQVLALEAGGLDGLMSDKLIRDSPPDDRLFWAEALYSRKETVALRAVDTSRKQLNAVAGGVYWEEIARSMKNFDDGLPKLIAKYRERLSQWFNLTAAVPIYADEYGVLPKYWMVFGSRYRPALDLINDAACSARRSQQIAWKTEESLFAGVAVDTSTSPEVVLAEVRQRIRSVDRIRWDEFRWKLQQSQIGRFKQSEIDKAIRELVERHEVLWHRGASAEEDESELEWKRR
jgi:three-Cys-motif partner protein